MTAPTQDSRRSFLDALTQIRPGEGKAVSLSFAFFLCVLCSYYIVRPLRDEMAVSLGGDFIQESFLISFLVLGAAVPVFGWIVARAPRWLIVPALYGFFIACLIGFWLMHRAGAPSPALASVFFIWVNVFALFTVSLFWSSMSDAFDTEQAKRLFGVISVGGTLGGLTGPILVNVLLPLFGTEHLFLISGLFLAIAAAAAVLLRRAITSERSVDASKRSGGNALAGAINVWRSPYLFRIAIWIFVGNLITMFFYLEQARTLSEFLPDRDSRILFLARMEAATNVLTILFESLLTARLLKRFGSGRTLLVAPVIFALLLAAWAISPSLWVLATVMVVSRAVGYGICGPAMRGLYTVVDPADKYRAQNFIDTVVQRGGNSLSSWICNTAAKGLGLAAPVIAVAALPLALLWAWVSLDLGRRQDALTQDKADGPRGSMVPGDST